MACDRSNCTANAVVTLGSITFEIDQWLDSGTLVDFGDTETPNQTIQRNANGDIAAISNPPYVTQEITITAVPCSTSFEEAWSNHIQGNHCYGSLVINDPCCDNPVREYKDAIITSMSQADIGYDEKQTTITLTAVPVS